MSKLSVIRSTDSDDKAVGTVALGWEDESSWGSQDPDAGYIHRLAIKDGYQGQGIGEQMIDWANNQLKQNNRQFLRLDCAINNKALCTYYEKQGFVRVAEKEYSPTYTAALYERPIIA